MQGRWLLAAGAAAPVLYALIVIGGGFAYPGYSHVGNTISDLMATGAPNRLAVSAGLAGACLLATLPGLVIRTRLGRDGRFIIASWAMIVVGILGAAISFFPVDGVPGPRAPAELIHLALTGAVFIAMATAVGSFAFAARRVAGLNRTVVVAGPHVPFEPLASGSFVAFGVILASGIATALAEAYDFEAVGVLERLLVGTYLVWFLVVATALLRPSRNA